MNRSCGICLFQVSPALWPTNCVQHLWRPGDDKKETPLIFKIRRWRMGACNKMCIALVAVCVLFGCAAPLQETTQIKCTGSDGQLLYAGPYNEENLSEYIVQVDDWTLAVYRKGACRKVQA
jgi:hypothetical protein